VIFGSARKLSANVNQDSSLNSDFVTSLISTGYHRTASELEDRNRLQMLAYGGTLRHQWLNGRIAFNTVRYKFSKPIIKEALPYNLFAFSGNQWSNYSVDYNYTFKNIHFFGEIAIDNSKNFALLNGLLASIDPKVDITVVHRSLNKAYQSFFSNAFTENTLPSNENGLFAGISIRPVHSLRIDGYIDIFRFPWLTARMDAPAYGKEYLVQVNYTPTKQLDFYIRIRWDSKPSNSQAGTESTEQFVDNIRRNWRTQVNYAPNKNWELRNRVEMVWNRKGIGQEMGKGFLSYTDVFYKPGQAFWGGNIRLQYFEGDSYETRIYAFENDLLYSYSLPGFSDKGYRFYFVTTLDIKKMIRIKLPFKATLSAKFAQTFFLDSYADSGTGTIPQDTKTDIKLQLIFHFNK